MAGQDPSSLYILEIRAFVDNEWTLSCCKCLWKTGRGEVSVLGWTPESQALPSGCVLAAILKHVVKHDLKLIEKIQT